MARTAGHLVGEAAELRRFVCSSGPRYLLSLMPPSFERSLWTSEPAGMVTGVEWKETVTQGPGKERDLQTLQ